MDILPDRDVKVLEIHDLLTSSGFKYLYIYLDKLIEVERIYINKFISRIVDEKDLIELNSHIANCKLLTRIKEDLEDSLRSLPDESNVTETVAVHNTTDSSWRNTWTKVKQAIKLRTRLA